MGLSDTNCVGFNQSEKPDSSPHLLDPRPCSLLLLLLLLLLVILFLMMLVVMSAKRRMRASYEQERRRQRRIDLRAANHHWHLSRACRGQRTEVIEKPGQVNRPDGKQDPTNHILD